jgi:hypothetical protein
MEPQSTTKIMPQNLANTNAESILIVSPLMVHYNGSEVFCPVHDTVDISKASFSAGISFMTTAGPFLFGSLYPLQDR